jgi:hypothetical protein
LPINWQKNDSIREISMIRATLQRTYWRSGRIANDCLPSTDIDLDLSVTDQYNRGQHIILKLVSYLFNNSYRDANRYDYVSISGNILFEVPVVGIYI